MKASVSTNRSYSAKAYFLPWVVFVIFSTGSITLYHFQEQHEQEQIKVLVSKEADNIEGLIQSQIKERLSALQRMATRWEAADGTPFTVWQRDAENYIRTLSGLRAIEWADRNYHIKWVVPIAGNEKAVGLNIVFDKKRAEMLRGVAESNAPTITPPLKLIQGYHGFISYAPVKAHGEFDGFMVGIISIEEFFGSMLINSSENSYAISVSYEGTEYFRNNLDAPIQNSDWVVERKVRLYDKVWVINIAPTVKLLSDYQTFMPIILLIAGFLISTLSALALRYIFVARLRAENLLESQIFSNSVIESLPDLFLVKDKNFRIVQANSKFLSLYPEDMRSSVIGTTTIENYSKSEADIFLEKDIEAFTTGMTSYEETIRFPNGQLQPLYTTKVRFNDSKNEPYIICIGQDISERKAVETRTEILKTIAMIINENNSLETLLSKTLHTICGMIGWPIGHAYLWNEKKQKLTPSGCWYVEEENALRYSEFQEITNQTEFAVGEGLPGRVLENNLPLWVADVENDTNFSRIRSLSKVNIHAGFAFPVCLNGKCKVVLEFFDANAILQDQSLMSAMTAIGDQLSLALERQENEKELLELMDQLIKSNTELERFAYIASHDMQEPIRMVTNFSEIIATDYANVIDEKGKEYLNFVVNAGKRMRNLVDDLLAYSRMGNESPKMEEFSGENTMAGACDNIRELIAERKAEITHDTLPKVYGNPVQIMRLIQNLITNAIKYQPKGNIPHVHISAEEQQEHWIISVKDNGMGIEAEYIEQIFQPFRRLHSWESINGTGLGLSICKKIAENHGGKIEVSSELGQGSVFAFSISKQLA